MHMMLVPRKPSGASIALMQRPWEFLFRHRHVTNTIDDTATFHMRLLCNGQRFSSTCSIFGNVSIQNGKLKQWSLEQQLSSSMRSVTTYHSFQLQQQFQSSQQLRCYSTTRPTNKTRHSKNMMDRLYNAKIFKTNHEDEILAEVDYAQTIKSKPPLKWLQKSWQQQFCEMVPRDKNKVSSPPTKIVNEYHYNDTPSNNHDDTDQLQATTKPSKGLSVIEKEKKKKMNVRRDEEEYNNHVTRQVQHRSGKSYSKTTSVQRTSKDGTFTSVTTISSSNFDPNHDSDDSDDDIDVRKYFSDLDDDDDNFFADSDDEDVDVDVDVDEDDDDDDYDDNNNQHYNIIDMPATASKTVQQQPSLNPQPTEEFPMTKKSQKSSSSSSWSISLNDDADYDLNHTDDIGSAKASQWDTKEGIPHPKTKHSNDTDEEGDICYEWDHDAQKMKPIVIIRSKDADMSNVERSNTFDTELNDTGWDRESNGMPDKFAHMKSNFIKAATEDDEYTEDVVDINNYLQTTKPRLVPRTLENWWDRDDDLVEKAKRKTKLATIRRAQDEPLNKRCKTCPVCKRVFKGHAAFLDHAINKGNCSKDIDASILEQMKLQKVEMKTKHKEKRKRKRNFTMDDMF